MNKIIKNTLILAAITVVSGLVLGAAYEVTKGPIAQTQAKQKQEACQAVYPEADSFEAMDVDQKAAKEAIKKMGTNATVDEVYSAVMDGSEAGYVITVTDKDGYGGDIQITVGKWHFFPFHQRDSRSWYACERTKLLQSVCRTAG